jgi:hypothetical protein
VVTALQRIYQNAKKWSTNMKSNVQATPTPVRRKSAIDDQKNLKQILSYLHGVARIVEGERHDARVVKCGYNAHETHTRNESGAIELAFTSEQDAAYTRALYFGWSLIGCWSEPVAYGPAKVLVIMSIHDQVAGLLPSGKMVRAPNGRKTFDIPRQWWNAT